MFPSNGGGLKHLAQWNNNFFTRLLGIQRRKIKNEAKPVVLAVMEVFVTSKHAKVFNLSVSTEKLCSRLRADMALLSNLLVL